MLKALESRKSRGLVIVGIKDAAERLKLFGGLLPGAMLAVLRGTIRLHLTFGKLDLAEATAMIDEAIA